MARRLVNKVAVVTAATDGIGRDIARRLASEGAAVVISGRRQEQVDAAVTAMTSQGHRVHGVTCRMWEPEDRHRLLATAVEKYGRLDFFIANAAYAKPVPDFRDTTEVIWDRTFDVNVKSTFFLIKEAVGYMQKSGGGAIVLNISVAAYIGEDWMAAYSIAKTSLLGMVRALVNPLAGHNIRINAIAPGLTRTPNLLRIMPEKSLAEIANAKIPMKRIAEPDECAGAVAFLVSDDASYVTGETLVISGGMYAHL